jgi:hypothetical protein
MTAQDRPYAKPYQIRAIRLTCRNCAATINLSPTSREYVPETCPYCKQGWFQRDSKGFTHLTKLIQALDWLTDDGNDNPCHVHFEVMPSKP